MAVRATALLILLVLLAAPALRGQDEPEDPPEKPKPAPTAEELDRKLDKITLTVDWNATGGLDALNEVRTKTGLKLSYDQELADFADTRKITYDGYQVSAREALAALQRAIGFKIEPDAADGTYKLSMDPSAPTLVALKEKKLSVAWRDAPLAKAVADIEKKTGLKIEIHPTMRARLSSRKITWEAEDVTAREAIETLYVYPPPSIAGRIDAKKGMKVVVVYIGAAESKADVEFFLDDRKVSLDLADADIAAAAKALGEKGSIRVEIDGKSLKEVKRVSYAAKDVTLRAALDAVARAAGLTWKVEGAPRGANGGSSLHPYRVVLRAAPPGK